MTGPSAHGQDQVFAFLADPATHGLSAPIKRVDTHAAAVFLAGPDVYKVKRAIRFPFMDQSTLARRRAACETEVRVNRAFTPDLYLGAVPIARADGKLTMGGSGEPVEWVVHMRRFEEDRTLDLVADRGEITPDLIVAVARLILASHRDAKVGDGARATAALAGVVAETMTELVEAPDIFPTRRAKELAAAMRDAFEHVRPLLLDRGADGNVRRCHGDLHLRNIALLDRGPILFDAIEFDESIATTDVLYDLAFTLMDLCERRLTAEANLLLNRYLWGSGDIRGEISGLAALPLFLSLRAAVLAKVDAIRYREIERSEHTRAEALRHFDSAATFLAPSAPTLVAVGGLSGTGKTTLATRLAPGIGRAPGAVHLRSDIERKRLLGAPELDRLPDSAYTSDVTQQVYANQRDQADAAIRTGHSAVVDAVHATAEERDAIAAVARRAGVRFAGLWLDAPPDVLIARVAARHGDASDATPRVVAEQTRWPLGPIDWRRVDGSGGADAIVETARAVVEEVT